MAIVREDILKGTGGSKDIHGWRTIKRIVIVDGLGEASDPGGWVAIMDEAFDAAGISVGDAHPDISTIYLQDAEVEALDKHQVKLTLTYARLDFRFISGFEDGAVEVGASVIARETNKDKNGTEMFLSYSYPKGYQRSPHDTPLTEASEADVQGHMATVMWPQVVWTVNQVETISKADLKTKAKTYVGKVNSGVWDGCAAGTVLCMRIQGRSTDGGVHFNVQYEYEYRAETWDHIALYIRDNGKPPPETDANSLKTYRLQSEADFSSLPAG